MSGTSSRHRPCLARVFGPDGEQGGFDVAACLYLGPWCVYSNDATAAGVRQRLKRRRARRPARRGRARPWRAVGMAPRGDNWKMPSWCACYASASIGGVLLRGNANHQHHEASLLTPMLISAITPPLLEAQDRSRVPRLHLTDPPVGAPDARLFALAPEIGPASRRAYGRWLGPPAPDRRAGLAAGLGGGGLRGRLVGDLGQPSRLRLGAVS